MYSGIKNEECRLERFTRLGSSDDSPAVRSDLPVAVGTIEAVGAPIPPSVPLPPNQNTITNSHSHSIISSSFQPTASAGVNENVGALDLEGNAGAAIGNEKVLPLNDCSNSTSAKPIPRLRSAQNENGESLTPTGAYGSANSTVKPVPLPRKKKPPNLSTAGSALIRMEADEYPAQPLSPSILGVPSPTPLGGLDNPEYVKLTDLRQMLVNRDLLDFEEKEGDFERINWTNSHLVSTVSTDKNSFTQLSLSENSTPEVVNSIGNTKAANSQMVATGLLIDLGDECEYSNMLPSNARPDEPVQTPHLSDNFSPLYTNMAPKFPVSISKNGYSTGTVTSTSTTTMNSSTETSSTSTPTTKTTNENNVDFLLQDSLKFGPSSTSTTIQQQQQQQHNSTATASTAATSPQHNSERPSVPDMSAIYPSMASTISLDDALTAPDFATLQTRSRSPINEVRSASQGSSPVYDSVRTPPPKPPRLHQETFGAVSNLDHSFAALDRRSTSVENNYESAPKRASDVSDPPNVPPPPLVRPPPLPSRETSHQTQQNFYEDFLADGSTPPPLPPRIHTQPSGQKTLFHPPDPTTSEQDNHLLNSDTRHALHHQPTSGPTRSEVPTGENICFSGWVRGRTSDLNTIAMAMSSTMSRKMTLRQHTQDSVLTNWWCVMQNGKINLYANSDTDSEHPLFSNYCNKLCYIGRDFNAHNEERNNSTSKIVESDVGEVLFGLILVFSGDKDQKPSTLNLYVQNEQERSTWLMLIGKTFAPSNCLAELIDNNLDQAGILYTKQNTGGIWQRSWALRNVKTFTYYRMDDDDEDYLIIDVRKIHYLKQDNSTSWCPDTKATTNPPFLISQDDFSLYVHADYDCLLDQWHTGLLHELKNDSNKLAEQRLSKDDVPILVKKCVKFLDTHGLTEKGLHRLSGTTSRVRALLEEFKKDPIDVHIRIGEYTVHDVASALRKFLRGLDDSLLPKQFRSEFVQLSALPESDYHLKVTSYKSLLDSIPRVNFSTLKELLGHLKLLAELSHGNQMTVGNIATIFGTTLFNVEKELCDTSTLTFNRTGEEINVLVDLISGYNSIFQLTAEEIGKRALVSSRLQEGLKFHQSPQGGSLLVPIHVFELENEPFQKEVSLTAGEICEFAKRHKNLPVDTYSLFELIRGGQLRRPMKPEERLLDVVVKRWHNADSAEISGCHLLINKDLITSRLQSSEPYPFAGDIKFADEGSKSFKKASLAFKGGDVCHYKDSKMAHLAHRWKGEELLWFFGAENKRDPPYKHNLSFIRSESVPNVSKYYGMCVSFKDENDMYRWLAAVTPVAHRRIR